MGKERTLQMHRTYDMMLPSLFRVFDPAAVKRMNGMLQFTM